MMKFLSWMKRSRGKIEIGDNLFLLLMIILMLTAWFGTIYMLPYLKTLETK